MADTYTTNLNLTKPEPGAAEDTWGISLNADLDSLDAIFSSSGTQVNLNPNQINFADNKKAIFGTGSDLQIYHDSSNGSSVITEAGGGDLLIKGANLRLQSPTGENYFVAINNSSSYVYYDGSAKLATTSTGIDVTGTVTSDGLTVDNSLANPIKIRRTTSGSEQLEISVNDGNVIFDSYQDEAGRYGGFTFQGTENGVGTIKRFEIAHTTGDISFYDDTGSTQGLFWDASAESLGIGTTSPSATLELSNASTAPKLRLSNEDNSVAAGEDLGVIEFYSGDDSGGGNAVKASISAIQPTTTPVSGELVFKTSLSSGSLTTAMTIDSSQRVGIGTDSPSRPLHVYTSATIPASLESTSTVSVLKYENSGQTGSTYAGSQNDDFYFHVNDAERMRIDSSGNVLVGVTSTTLSGDSITLPNSGIIGFHDAGGNARNVLQFVSGTIKHGAAGAGVDTQTFHTSNTERMRIDSSGNVGIKTIDPDDGDFQIGDANSPFNIGIAGPRAKFGYDGASSAVVQGGSSKGIKFCVNNGTLGSGEAGRFDISGNLLVGATSYAGNSSSVTGSGLSDGYMWSSRSANAAAIFNRLSTDGEIALFRKDGTTVGNIGCPDGANGSQLVIAAGSGGTNTGVGLRFTSFTVQNIIPCYDDGSSADNHIDLGNSGARFDDIYATNGTIQTSDRNEKQDIQALTDAEQRVATACKGLIRRFRWQDAVEEKGDDARLHFGVIAQDLQDAFSAEGLDAGDYGMFISSTWEDDDGVEQTRLGVRYSELLAFIIAAI